MMSKLKYFRCIFADFAYVALEVNTKQIVNQDLDANTKFKADFKYIDNNYITKLNYLLCGYPYFRNILYYRLRSENGFGKLFAKISKIVLPELRTVEINGIIEHSRKL